MRIPYSNIPGNDNDPQKGSIPWAHPPVDLRKVAHYAILLNDVVLRHEGILAQELDAVE